VTIDDRPAGFNGSASGVVQVIVTGDVLRKIGIPGFSDQYGFGRQKCQNANNRMLQGKHHRRIPTKSTSGGGTVVGGELESRQQQAAPKSLIRPGFCFGG
jgi:hypothetical protein